jgi:membrane protein DedA with SNARE-associated domain
MSAFFWAAMTIAPAYYFGEQLLAVLAWIKSHWYFAIPLVMVIFGSLSYLFSRIEKKLLEKRRERKTI